MKRKAYVILGESKEGEFSGYVEQSFSMGYDKSRINVNNIGINPKDRYYTSPEERVRSLQNTCKKLNSYNNGYTFTVYRVGSKKCPIKIDWTERTEFHRKNAEYCGKYNYRNPPFTKK